MGTLTFTVLNIVRQGSDLSVWAAAESPVSTGEHDAADGQHIRNAQISFVVGDVEDPSDYVTGATFTAELAEPLAAPPVDAGPTNANETTGVTADPAAETTEAAPAGSTTEAVVPDPNYPHGGSTPVI